MRWKRTNITNEQGPALKVKLTVEGKDAVKLVKKHFPNCKSIIIVTTAYHMRRAAMLAQHFFTQKIIPCPASRGSTQRNNWSMTEKGSTTALDECLKFGYYIKKGFIDDFEI